MPETLTLALLWVVVAASWVLAFHELRHRDPPDLVLPPPEQTVTPLDWRK